MSWKGNRYVGFDVCVNDRGLFRSMHRLHVCLRETLNHGKRTCRHRFDFAADLPVCRDAATREVLSVRLEWA